MIGSTEIAAFGKVAVVAHRRLRASGSDIEAETAVKTLKAGFRVAAISSRECPAQIDDEGNA